MKTKTLFAFGCILALLVGLLALAVPGQAAQDISKKTVNQDTRDLFEATAGSLDGPLCAINSTVNSPDVNYSWYVHNGTGNVSQPIPYAVNNIIYFSSNGTCDLSAVNTWTTMGNNTVCGVIVHIDSAGVVNATQGTIVAATAAGNATFAWPEPPDDVAVICGLKLYTPQTAQLTIGTTALTQGTNAWAYGFRGSPYHALTQ